MKFDFSNSIIFLELRPPTDIHIIEVQHNLIELEWKKVQPESRYRIDVENIVLHSLSTFYTEKGMRPSSDIYL